MNEAKKNMVRYRFYIGMVAAALLLSSCSGEEENVSLPQETVGQISLTRSATGGTAPMDGGYGSLTVYAYEGTEEDNRTVWNYENGEWQQAGTLLVPVRDASFIGVTGTGTPFSFTLPEAAKDQSSESGMLAADFMSTDRTALGTGNSLTLDFKHRLSQVSVTVMEYGTEFGGVTPAIGDVTFQSAASIALDYDADETVTVTSAMTPTIDITPSGTLSDGYTALIAPKAAREQLMSLQVDGKTLSVKTTADIESGKSYTFSLKVGKDYVTLQNMTIKAWQEGKPQSGNTTNIALPEVTDAQAGLFIHYADGDADNVDNLKLGADASQTIEHVWKSSSAKPHIVIYSPYDANAAYDGTIALTYGTDYGYASINADGTQTVSGLLEGGGGNTLNVGDAYRHIMGKLTLVFNDGETMITPENVKLNNFYASATLALKSGAVSITGNRTKETGADGYDALYVIPQTIPQYGDIVSATYNGTKYVYTTPSDFTISGGEHVTLTLTIPATSTRSAVGDTPRRMKGVITIEKENK